MAKKLDPEVVELCKAINLFAGLRTYSSCCGHGKGVLTVWFKATRASALYPLLRAIDLRYGGPDGRRLGWEVCPWMVEAVCTDLPLEGESVTFVLSSRVRGAAAYAEALEVAANLRGIAADDLVLEKFGVKLRGVGEYVVLPQ